MDSLKKQLMEAVVSGRGWLGIWAWSGGLWVWPEVVFVGVASDGDGGCGFWWVSGCSLLEES